MDDELRYKPMLQLLSLSFGQNEFDMEAAFTLTYPSLVQAMRTTNYSVFRSVAAKRISNDLNRLHRMGFLSRKSVKRQVKTKSGLRCNRGYKYIYQISSQGRSYIGYLRNPESSLRRRQEKENADYLELLSIGMLRSKLPEDQKPYARRIHDALLPSEPTTPVDMRFPIHHDPSLVLLLNKVSKERDSFKQVARDALDLMKELQSQNRK